jgi:hypothetical protein
MASGGAGEPIIEVDGKLQFSLPGQPLFPALGDDTILKPTLDWILYSAQLARFDAELSYVSGGMRWAADYNMVAPQTGDTLELVGWVTLDNQSGKSFERAHVKLMAGDVSKLQAPGPAYLANTVVAEAAGGAPPGRVTERPFEDYHIYTLPAATTRRARETKQGEFLRAGAVNAKRLYIYDGAQIERGGSYGDRRADRFYGTKSNPHVWVMREFVNSDANHLGVPLPKGRGRFYRRDQDGQVEFIGENQIDHTPKDETVRVFTGNAFDIVGERKQTKHQYLSTPGSADESFEIQLRNRSKETATVRVVEHLYRWSNWAITENSDPYRQTDSRTIEWNVTVPAGGERKLTYTAHYTW